MASINRKTDFAILEGFPNSFDADLSFLERHSVESGSEKDCQYHLDEFVEWHGRHQIPLDFQNRTSWAFAFLEFMDFQFLPGSVALFAAGFGSHLQPKH